MLPYLFHHVPTYPLALLVGVVAAALVGARALHRECGLGRRDCLRLQAALTIAGLLGGKLYSLIERGEMASLAAEITQGFRYPGALVGAVAALSLLGRRRYRRVRLPALADALAPSVAVGSAIVRFGCFAHGCCFGSATSLPWAVRFPAESPPWRFHVTTGWIDLHAATSLPIHPLPLYFAVLSLAVGALAVWLQKRKAYAGEVALAFLAADGLGKWTLEWLREEPLPAVQLASLLLAMAAVTMLTLLPAISPAPGSASSRHRETSVRHRRTRSRA